MEPLKRRRDAIKRKITRIAGDVGNLEAVPTKLSTFEEYLSSVETAFKDYIAIKQSIVTEIDRLEKSEENNQQEILVLYEEQEVEFDEIENSFVLLKASLKSKIVLLKGASNRNGNSCVSKVQLPQLKLPVFSGKYEDFESFREKFSALVHSSTEIKVIQKFQFLLDCLSDNVRRAFDHLEFSEANYLVVLELLKERYSNRKLAIDRHLSGLVGLKSMTKESSVELQGILDEASAHISALESLNVAVGTWDVMIVYLVSIRLDSETRKRWEETVNKDELPEWERMKAFLQKRCYSLETVELSFDCQRKMSFPPSS